jgi:PKD repeat protein/glucose/arabinose dehydrogenase
MRSDDRIVRRAGRRKRSRLVFQPLVMVVTSLLIVAALLPSASTRAATLPAGFQESIVWSGLTNPTALRFAPDGRVFVAEKSGIIKVFDNLSDPTPTMFADLRTNVHNFWDRGLLGLAIDPNFPIKPYVYALYTFDAPIGGTAPRWGTAGGTSDGCPSPPGATADGCVVGGRLSRLEAAGNVMTGGERVLIENWCQQYPSHSIGDLVFGSDGALYVSAGDGASFNFTDYGQDGNPLNPCGDPPGGVGATLTPPTAEGGALRSQDLRTAADPAGGDGTILRVDPETGSAFPTNPLIADPDPFARRVIAYGLRNPFRITARPGTNEVWVGDVGWGVWEEINRIANPSDSAVENFGWPCYEGAGRQSGYDGANLNICETIYAGSNIVTSPYYTYRHSDKVVAGETCGTGDSSTAGLAFYDAGSYPASYNGALFFADYSRDCIWAMLRGANGQPDPNNRITFAAAAANPVDLEIGPGGDLFYVDLNGGSIRRIQYFSANQPPTARASASPTNGPAPLSVAFDGTASSDPEGRPLSYAWDLDGDGAFDDSTASQPTWTYVEPGNYSVKLRVTDADGASNDSQPLLITANNTPPVASIDAPASTLTWRVGDTIAFSGSASDAQDGALPASALSWSLIMHHCSSATSCHTHPLQDFAGVASGSFSAPDHEYPSHLELRLTATDDGGLVDTRNVILQPQTSDLAFQTSPTGLQLVVGSSSAVAPFTRKVIVGSNNTVSAPSPQTIDATTYTWGSWSDGGAQTHTITAGSGNTTYTASYRANAPIVKSLQFNGGGTQVQVADNASLRISTNLTAEAWIKPTAVPSGHRHIVGKNNWELSVEPSGAGVKLLWEFATSGGWRSVASGEFPLNQWYHVAGTYDGSTMRLFVNGSQVGSRAGTGNIVQTTNPLRIGSADGSGDIFTGLIDEVRVSNVVRYSGSFTRPQGPFTPDANTRGLWHLDEGSGSTTADVSGNNNTGTLLNNPIWADDSPFRTPDTTPPTISNVRSGNITATSATISWTTDETATTQIEYGTTTAYGSRSTFDPTLLTAHSQVLSGLLSNTTYNYRVLSRDADGNSATSGNFSFTTPAAAPVITNVVASNVSQTGATISWLTDIPADSQVEYGTTTAYGSSTTLDPTLVTSHSQSLTGLLENTIYHYRVGSRAANGLLTTSPDATFTTASATPTGGFALQFNGTSSHVRVADAPSLRLASNLTLEAWIKPTSVSGHRHIAGKNNYELSIEPSGSGFKALWEFSSGGSWRSVASGSYPLNQWYHVAGTYDGSTMRLFVNGTLVGTQTTSGTIDQTSNPFRIGSADGSGDLFPGVIDEVRLSSTVRYTASFARPQASFTTDASTRGLWHLDEGSGTTTIDASGGNNTGTLINNPVWVTDLPY